MNSPKYFASVLHLGMALIVLVAGGRELRAIENGDFEISSAGNPLPSWFQLGGVASGPPALGSGFASARFTDGAGRAVFSGGANWRGAGIAQRFQCGETSAGSSCYLRFTYAYDDRAGGMAPVFVAMRGPAGSYLTWLRDNDGIPTTVQLAYPACGLLDVAFGILELGAPGTFQSIFSLDAVEDRCGSVAWPGVPQLPWGGGGSVFYPELWDGGVGVYYNALSI